MAGRHRVLLEWFALAALVGLGGCPPAAEFGAVTDQSVGQSTIDSKGGKPMTLTVTSSAFADGERIPVKYTGEGEDVSPPIEWSGVPAGTKEFALVCDDPDAPTEDPWVHWVIYKIPADVTSLSEGLPQTARIKGGPMLQGQNSWSKTSYGYKGPMPPPGHGTHHYHFTVYALDSKAVVEPGETKKQLLDEIADHILAQGRLIGIYSR